MATNQLSFQSDAWPFSDRQIDSVPWSDWLSSSTSHHQFEEPI